MTRTRTLGDGVMRAAEALANKIAKLPPIVKHKPSRQVLRARLRESQKA